MSLTMAIMRTLVVAAFASVVKSQEQCFNGHFTINVDTWDAGYTDALAAAIAALAGDQVAASDVTAVATEGGTAALGSCTAAWAARPVATAAPAGTGMTTTAVAGTGMTTMAPGGTGMATTAAPAVETTAAPAVETTAAPAVETTAMSVDDDMDDDTTTPSSGPQRLLEESDDVPTEELWLDNAEDTPRRLQSSSTTTTVAGAGTATTAAAATAAPGTVHVAYTIIADAAVVGAIRTTVGAVTAADLQTQVDTSFAAARAANGDLPAMVLNSATGVTAGDEPAARPAPAPAPAPDTTSDALKVLPLFSLIFAGFLA